MTEFGLASIGQIALTVADAGEATAFYRDRLGMRHLFTAPPGLSFFDCDGIRLMLAEPEGGVRDGSRDAGGDPAPGWVLYFVVEDIGAGYAALRDRGVEFVHEPHKVADLGETELWLGSFQDPWGNTLALMSEVPAGRAG